MAEIENESKINVAEPTEPIVPTPVAAKSSRLAFLKNKNNRLLFIVAAVALVLIGGSAAAYYGVVAPNKPENILKTAVEKQLKKQQIAAKGSISVDLTQQESSIKNVTVNFKSALDNPKQAFSAELETAVSGAKLPVELRGVDKNLYFKIGDLSSIKGLAALAGGEEAGAVIDAIGDKLSNQWIEVDESLLKQANAECATGLIGGFSQKDIDELMKVYSENTFVTIKSKTASVVEGKDTTKFELGVDKQKAMEFGIKLNNVELFKKINECSKNTTNQGGDEEVKDELKDTDISLNVWVDSDKNLRQVEIKATDKEASATVIITYTDDPVDIQKPEGAKPLMEILGDFSQFFGGASLLNQDIGSNDPLDELSDECKAAFQAYASSGGTTDLPTDCL